MELLSLQDVESIVRLLGSVAGMTEPIPDRRRALMVGLAELIDSDIWMWLHSRIEPGSLYPSAFQVLDGGWRDETERGRFINALHDPEMNNHANQDVLHRQHTTQLRQQFLQDGNPALDKWTRLSGMREAILSVYSLDPRHFSGIGFHRRAGRAKFTEKHRYMVHLITSQSDWLHRANTDVAGNDDRLLQLTPRQREIMVHLLSGAGRKQIAQRVGLSEHTVADHMKSIYKIYNVSSRPELQSLFMAGGVKR